MKNFNQIAIYILMAGLLATGCKKIERLPETETTDANFWNTESDLMNAANRLYQQLPETGQTLGQTMPWVLHPMG
jgi:hypothetical protein